MSRLFTGAQAQFIEHDNTLIAGVTTDPRPLSIACWFYPTTNTTRHSIFTNNFVDDGPGDPGLYVEVNLQTTHKLRLYSGGYATNSSTFTFTTNQWHHLCWTWATGAPGTISYYLNGGAIGTPTFTWVSGDETDGAAWGTLVGTSAIPDFVARGRLAECSVWDDVLTTAEVVSLAAGVNSMRIRPNALVSYQPVGYGSPEPELAPGVGQTGARTWTIGGTLAIANHAPVSPPFGNDIGIYPPAGAAAVGQPTMRRWGNVPHMPTTRPQFGRAG